MALLRRGSADVWRQRAWLATVSLVKGQGYGNEIHRTAYPFETYSHEDFNSNCICQSDYIIRLGSQHRLGQRTIPNSLYSLLPNTTRVTLEHTISGAATKMRPERHPLPGGVYYPTS